FRRARRLRVERGSLMAGDTEKSQDLGFSVDVSDSSRTPKVGPSDTQDTGLTTGAGAARILSNLPEGTEIRLPDGRFFDVDALMEAIQSGAQSVRVLDGTEISIDQLLVALGLETGVPQLEEDEEEAENQQASFRQGPLLEIIQSLIEQGAINPTQLFYPSFEMEDSLTGLADDDSALTSLAWSIAGDPTVTEGTD